MPKGHNRPGEDDITAALREIHEEAGVTKLELIKELGDYQRYRVAEDGAEDRSKLKTIKMFLFKTKDDILNPLDEVIHGAKWVKKSEVENLLTHPKDKEFFSKIISDIE